MTSVRKTSKINVRSVKTIGMARILAARLAALYTQREPLIIHVDVGEMLSSFEFEPFSETDSLSHISELSFSARRSISDLFEEEDTTNNTSTTTNNCSPDLSSDSIMSQICSNGWISSGSELERFLLTEEKKSFH